MTISDVRNGQSRVKLRRFASMRSASRIADGGFDAGPLPGHHIDPIKSMGNDESLTGAIHIEIVYMFFGFLMAVFWLSPTEKDP